MLQRCSIEAPWGAKVRCLLGDAGHQSAGVTPFSQLALEDKGNGEVAKGDPVEVQAREGRVPDADEEEGPRMEIVPHRPRARRVGEPERVLRVQVREHAQRNLQGDASGDGGDDDFFRRVE